MSGRPDVGAQRHARGTSGEADLPARALDFGVKVVAIGDHGKAGVAGDAMAQRPSAREQAASGRCQSRAGEHQFGTGLTLPD
jgi:hypothetical protein